MDKEARNEGSFAELGADGLVADRGGAASPGGGFRFLTSWRCDPPAVPTAYPAWAPELVIPLEGLAPYRAPELQVERRSGDPAGAPSITRFEPEEFLDGGFGVEVFTGLFGQRGLRISYNGWLDERYCGTFTDYYTFADDGAPSLLL